MSRFADRFKNKQNLLDQTGVTLIEMMIYMVIAGMLLGMAVTAFLGQNKSYNRQEVIAEIQQNIRGGTEQMASDIRLAGVGFFESATVEAFGHADNSSLTINQWPDGEDYFSGTGGSSTDQISVHYRLNGTDLGRAIGSVGDTPGDVDGYFRPIAENIDDFRLEYQIESGGYWRWVGSPTDLEEIRAVKIMVLGGARESAFNRTDNTVYDFPLDESGQTHTYPPVPGTSYTGYKRFMSTVVQARNNRE